MHGHERGGAGGIDGEIGAFDAESVGDASASDAASDAGGEVGVENRGITGAIKHLGIFVGGERDENAGAVAAEIARILRGVLEGFPGDLEKQALLGVHGNGFARRNTEKFGIELIDVIEERGVARGHFAGRVGIGIVVVVEIPAGLGNFGNCVGTGLESAPEFLRIRGAGETAAHADDGDGFVALAVGSGEASFHFLESKQGLLEWREIGEALRNGAHVLE